MGIKIETEVEYGKSYESITTGYVGIAVAVTKWRYGCVRILLQPRVGKDNKQEEGEWFDEADLSMVLERKTGEKPIGGPTPNPKQNPMPKEK